MKTWQILHRLHAYLRVVTRGGRAFRLSWLRAGLVPRHFSPADFKRGWKAFRRSAQAYIAAGRLFHGDTAGAAAAFRELAECLERESA